MELHLHRWGHVQTHAGKDRQNPGTVQQPARSADGRSAETHEAGAAGFAGGAEVDPFTWTVDPSTTVVIDPFTTVVVVDTSTAVVVDPYATVVIVDPSTIVKGIEVDHWTSPLLW